MIIISFFCDNATEALLGSVNYKGNYNAQRKHTSFTYAKTSNKAGIILINGEGTI
jgi:hypothetical protein